MPLLMLGHGKPASSTKGSMSVE
ncbi:hypothetical protein NXF25_018744 [Crotalus adamanteus]|uniref:Uncharacterized protein n=1 Tax=Crotalus adamanteus TaxID=8729 RepID=A0AAW1AZT0_CROAD